MGSSYMPNLIQKKLIPLFSGRKSHVLKREREAYKIMTTLDVDYVLVIFGGVIGYTGDDINKFLWMVRIAEGEHPKDIRVRSEHFRNKESSVSSCSFFHFVLILLPTGRRLFHRQRRIPRRRRRYSRSAQLSHVQTKLLPLRRTQNGL